MTINLGLKTSAAVAAAASICLSAQHTEAATIIELSDGITTETVVDQGPGDLSPTHGVVVFSGVVGVFNVNVTTGLSKPLLGSDSEPILDLNSVNVSSGGIGTLTVKLTSTDYTGPAPGTATLDVGGTTNGTISVDSFIDPGNAPFGAAIPTGSLGLFTPGPFSGSSGGPAAVTPLTSATIIATITHDDLGDVTSFDAEYRIVPEPGSLALIGLGGLFLARRRRRA